ncbi:MAG: type II secretion system protein [Kiritimatiellaeota bacterium]|nr:type II secretion system protein [Kiritimatiellota bacterium]
MSSRFQRPNVGLRSAGCPPPVSRFWPAAFHPQPSAFSLPPSAYSPQPSAFRRGFTLIELLVVIAVIAVLMAMLMPAAQSAMRKGKLAKCMGNARQIVMLLNLAVQDLRLVYPDTSGNDNAFAQDNSLTNYFKDVTLLRCPSDSGAAAYPGGAQSCYSANAGLASYCYAKSDVAAAGVAGMGGRKLTIFRSPSQKAVIFEPTLSSANSRNWHTTTTTPRSGVVGYMDTHALLAPTNYSAALSPTVVPDQDRLYY